MTSSVAFSRVSWVRIGCNMLNIDNLKSNGSDRLGLAMVVASLAAIALIVATLLWHEKETQETQIRAQGVSLTRLLSGMPYAQLVPTAGRQSLLSTIFQSQNDPNFAYVALVDSGDMPVAVSSAPGVTVSPMEWPETPVGWLSERTVTAGHGKDVIEFYSPLYADGSIVAYLRLGYLLPGMGVSMERLPFFATLALIVFLLTPLFYLLVRKEIRPLKEANARISSAIESEQFRKVEIGTSNELSSFIDRFNALVDFASQRIDRLESEKERLTTSKHLITYSKTRVENVLEAIPEAVLVLDQSGNVSFANHRFSALMGVPLDEVMDSDPSDWCENSELLEVISNCSGRAATSYLSQTVRMDIGSKKKRKSTVKAYPLFSPTDSTETLGTLIVFRDVSKETAMQRQQGEFVSHVAHELKTPLNTLSLCSEVLLDDDGEDPQVSIEAANTIRDEVERLAGLIDNLLSITKIELGEISIERQRLRLNDFLEDAFQVASRSDKGNELTFELDLRPDLCSIMADKELLRIAINNLLTNAVKYSEPGGVISMSCVETEQTVRIAVSDEGIGIQQDEQDKIFERFYRTEDAEVRKRVGHGLGLSLALDIVQLHNGTLNVTSKPNEGSEFVIEIWKEAGLLKQAI